MSMSELPPALEVRLESAPGSEPLAASTLVRGAAQMAKLLISSNPSQAKGFAASMHERVSGTDDDVKLMFWSVVLDMLIAHQGGGAAPERGPATLGGTLARSPSSLPAGSSTRKTSPAPRGRRSAGRTGRTTRTQPS